MASQRKAGVVLGYINLLTKNVVNLIYTPMLLAFVGQADYGVFQTSNSFVFSLTILSFGFSTAYISFYMQCKVKGDEEGIRTLNGMYVLLYGVVSAAALAIGLTFAANVETFFSGSFTSDQVELAGQLMGIMAFSLATSLFSTVFDAYITAHEQFRYQQTRQIFTTLATPCFALMLLCLGMGPVGVALAQLAVQLILLFLNARFSIGKLAMRASLRRFDKGLFRSLVAFSAWIFMNQLCELVNQSLPNVILAAFSSAMAVSVFAVSVQIRSVFYSISMTISNVFVPEINRIVADSDDNAVLTRLMARVGRFQAILYLWVLGGFALLGRFFISKWAGEGFADAYWLVLAMAASLFIPMVQNTGIAIQRAKNRHRVRSVAYLIIAVVDVTITFVLAPSVGYWAPAIGYVTYALMGCGLFMNWYYGYGIGLDMPYFWRRILPVVGTALLATGVCYAGSLALPVTGWLLFFAWGAVYSIVYASLTWALILNPEEKATVKAKLRRA